jgi:hypothetical protein
MAEGTAWLTPADLAAAEPDPFGHLEQDWLRHLDQAHPDVLHALARQIFTLSHYPGPARHRATPAGRMPRHHPQSQVVPDRLR